MNTLKDKIEAEAVGFGKSLSPIADYSGTSVEAAYESGLIRGAELAQEDEWISVINDPEDGQLIFVTDGQTVHLGRYMVGLDKICLLQGMSFDSGGSYCTMEDNYTHWKPVLQSLWPLPVPPTK